MSCREIVELATGYLEGTMPAGERERFDAHLTGCPGCREYLAQMRETVRLTGQLREEDLAPAAREALVAAFRSWRERPAT
ncbi:MAG: zf-HC2 domain-containing protein [Dehalococcoidia bacterium]